MKYLKLPDMKNILALFILILLIAGGCKYFKKPERNTVDTLVADTMSNYNASSMFEPIAPDVSQSERVNQPSQNVTDRYFMIVGCFVVPQNAESYVKKLQGLGYSATIIQGRGNFQMVSAKSYNNYQESISEIARFRNDVTPGAWVYVSR